MRYNEGNSMQQKQLLHGEFVLKNEGEKVEKQEIKHPHQSASSPRKQHNTAHFFSQIVEHPDNIRFATQEKDEHVYLVLRAHMIANLPWIGLSLIFILIPLVGYPILASLFPFFSLHISTQIIILVSYYIMVFGYIFVNFTLWYFHTAIVTNKKVIDIDIHGILSKDIVEAQLSSILDVGYTQVGVFQSLLNYGDVTLQTETRLQNLEMLKAPNPSKVVRMISTILEKEKNDESA